MKTLDGCTNCGCLCFIMLHAVVDWMFVIHRNATSDVSMGIGRGTGRMYMQTEQGKFHDKRTGRLCYCMLSRALVTDICMFSICSPDRRGKQMHGTKRS